MSARVLLLASKLAYQIDDLVAAARRLGVEPVVASDRCHVLAEVWPAGAWALDIRDAERAAGQIADHAARTPIAGIVPTDERTALIAALAARHLGLAHNPIAGTRAAGNKLLLRRALAAAGLAQPRFAAVALGVASGPDDLALGADVRAEAAAVGYPLVIKPTSLSASRGVMRVDTPAELDERIARLARLLADPEVAAVDPATAGVVLIESFVPGPEVAFEGLLRGGRLDRLALFDKPDPLDGPFFAETIYVTPSGLAPARQDEIAATVAAAAAALGLREGPVHAELRVPAGGQPVVLELAARSIGGLCGRVLRFGAGISLEEVVVAHAVGLDVGALGRAGAPAAGVLMLPVARDGVLAEVRGVDEVRRLPGVRDVVITARAGEHVVPLPEGRSYLGFVFAEGARADDVTGVLRRAHAGLEVDVRPRLSGPVGDAQAPTVSS